MGWEIENKKNENYVKFGKKSKGFAIMTVVGRVNLAAGYTEEGYN